MRRRMPSKMHKHGGGIKVVKPCSKENIILIRYLLLPRSKYLIKAKE